MRQNPFPKKARKLLDEAGLAYKYLEYGSYLGEWRRRLALKMWTGWPTFPMVFVKGVLKVAGPRESKRPGIYRAAKTLLERLLGELVILKLAEPEHVKLRVSHG